MDEKIIVKSLRIDRELYRKIKIHCAEQGNSIQMFVHTALQKEIERAIKQYDNS